ncbi:MAG: thiamine phosphate synthase [Clostridia bacterium]|nr:thiamine phosphate synthase [Clostridia bacterium]MCI9085101.1 thiamine phosphate synthase [Clostridia bacterium]
MFKIICVTNRKLCVGDFLSRVGELHKEGVTVILREKDLNESEYAELAEKVIKVCPDVILHTYTEAAKRLNSDKIHLPYSMLKANMDFKITGASVHSAKEAADAEKLGADYVTAGHIFHTDCKKGLAPRGLEFLKETVDAVSIPVYAIGGITPDNIAEIKETGAAGACIMSGFMQCENVGKYMEKVRKVD